MLKCALACLFFPVLLVALGTPQLPLAFEENRGQAASGAFLAHGKGYGISLSSDAAVISGVTIRFVGANPAARGKGEAKLPGIVNYFGGSDPGKWTSGLPTYRKVRFQGIYPAIDIVYYSNLGQVEFDLIAGPGADLGAIVFELAGAREVRIDPEGSLSASVDGRELRIRTPAIYQENGGVRQPVNGRFVWKGSHRIGFLLETYDKRRKLIIDPTIVYSTVFGGSATDYGAKVALDSSGNTYLAGSTFSGNFPATTGALQTSLAGTSNLFITKLNAAGTAAVYSTYLGGSGIDTAQAISVDSAGNAFVTGSTTSPNFPVSNALYPTLAGGTQGFVLKLNPSGTALLYSTYLIGSATGNTYGDGLAVDATGAAYVTGATTSPSFPVTPGAYSGPLPAYGCGSFCFPVVFLCKFNPAGTALTYSSLIGSGEANSVAVDSAGAAYVAGYTDFADFPVTSPTALNGSEDAFILKMNPTGSALVYATFLGGSNVDQVRGIAVDSAGQAYVAGYTQSSDFPVTAGAAQTLMGGSGDGFVAKLSASGSALLYATYLGGRNDDDPSAIALDSSGNAVITGSTTSPNFPVFSAFQNGMGGNPASLSTYNPSLGRWQPADAGFQGIAQSISLNASAGTAVVSTDAGTFRSTNGGAAWVKTSTVPLMNIARAPSSPSTLLGLDFNEESYSSADDGQTWNYQAAFSGFYAQGAVIDPTIPSTIYLIGSTGLQRSVSPNQFFTGVPSAPNPVSALVIAPGTPNVLVMVQGVRNIYRSLDGGATWIPINGVAASGLAQDPNALRTIYAFGYGSVINKSTDSGATWSPIPAPATVTALAVGQGNSAQLYAAVSGGAVISSDGGAHWSAVAPGLGTPLIGGISANSSTAFVLQTIKTTGFVTKLNASGTAFVYSSFLGGTDYDYGSSVATVGSDAIVAGYTSSTDFPNTGSTAQTINDVNAFLIRVSDNTAPCSYSLHPGSLFFYGAGGSSSVGVVSPAACTWNTASGASWLSTASNSASGTAPLSIAAAANPGSARTGTVIVGGQPVVVQQGGAGCAYSLSGYALYLPFAGGSGSVAVTAAAGCDWVTANNNSRISITAGSTGNGNGVVSFSVAPVSATATIAYQLTIAGIPFSLYQSSSNISQSITFSPLSTKPLGTAPFALSATATSGLAVVFASTSLSVCTVSGVTVTLLAGGVCSLTATQPGNATYGAAPAVTNSFVVNLALRYVPIAPCRIADTRKPYGPFGAPAIAGQSTRNFDIPGSGCGVPAFAQAYSVNVVVVPQGPLGYLTVWPAGQTQPLAATLNSDGRIKANAAIVAAGTGGAISFFASNTTELVLDINGYFVSAASAGSLAFYPVTPCRITDTRRANGLLGSPYLSGQIPRTLPIRASSCSIPATAQAYSLNFTAVPHGPLGYLTVWPTGQAQPTVSTLNAPTAAITANAGIVPAGMNGSIDLFASNDTDLVIDINGYFAPPLTAGLSFYNLSPCRILDSRIPRGTPAFAGNRDVAVAGACGATLAAQAFALNATVVPAEPLGYLTLWAQGATQPTVSTLNASDVAITDNMAIVPTANGSITAFASNLTQLVLDILGFFAP